MARGIKRKLQRAMRRAGCYIARSTPDRMYARGLAHEGWMGGYVAALNDVMLVLNGVTPNRVQSEMFWEERKNRYDE